MSRFEMEQGLDSRVRLNQHTRSNLKVVYERDYFRENFETSRSSNFGQHNNTHSNFKIQERDTPIYRSLRSLTCRRNFLKILTFGTSFS